MPHLGGDSLSRRLPRHGIDYVHLPELGGWRKPVPGSPNGGWQVGAFQGYADHMASAEFEAALERLVERGGTTRTAVMCAEGDWRRCHRRLLSDALNARGIDVVHIRPDGHTEMHELTSFARVSAGQVTYPPEQEALDI
jgi:uncharacterized protein (DUF488 family)